MKAKINFFDFGMEEVGLELLRTDFLNLDSASIVNHNKWVKKQQSKLSAWIVPVPFHVSWNVWGPADCLATNNSIICGKGVILLISNEGGTWRKGGEQRKEHRQDENHIIYKLKWSFDNRYNSEEDVTKNREVE